VFVLLFPQIDPVAFTVPFPTLSLPFITLGPLPVYWYGIAYFIGILGGWKYASYLVNGFPRPELTQSIIDNFLSWLIVGVIAGGRMGYVLFYRAGDYWEAPFEIFKTWKGGMSFHGGLIGVIVVMVLYARRFKIPLLVLSDLVAASTPIGIFFGRIANFINGELYGRSTDVPWGVLFPMGGDMARHPSQLYEAGLEGFVLFFILAYLAIKKNIRRLPGYLSGVFLIGYGIARIITECFREPDFFLGFIFRSLTMGQLLSIPMILLGGYLIHRSKSLS
jgi:phosphatidylglycerol:prolipoprotein diacylglycerol transferase